MDYFKDILGTRTLNGTEFINLTKSFKIKDIVNRDVFTESYIIKDGETLDTISFNLYGDVKFWWILALLNDISDPFYDIPLTNESLREWFVILLADGEVIAGDWANYVTENNAKRDIDILKPQYLNDFLYIVEKEMI